MNKEFEKDVSEMIENEELKVALEAFFDEIILEEPDFFNGSTCGTNC